MKKQHENRNYLVGKKQILDTKPVVKKGPITQRTKGK